MDDVEDVSVLDVDDSTRGGQGASLCGENGWTPGHTCGEWINTQHPLLEQGRVLVVNAVVAVSRIPSRLLKQFLAHVAPGGHRDEKKSIAHTLVGKLLCLSPSLVQKIVQEASRDAHRWTPCPRRSQTHMDELALTAPLDQGCASLPASSAGCAGLPAINADADARALHNLVRLAISTASEGRSWQAYVRDATRYRLAGGSVGSKYASRHFAVEAAAMASMVVQQLDSHDFNAVLPGLGIPSDFAVLADPVSMGDSIVSRHDILLIICLALASAQSGRVYNPMHSGRAMPVGSHGGAAMAGLLLRALAEHPASWSIYVLRARCACIGGDGGLVLGGPDHRHQSAAVAEHLWRLVHEDTEAGPTCTTWDPFHRVDIAVWRAVRHHERVMQIFDLAKEIDYLFGQSEGAIIFRSIATRLDEVPHMIRAPGGTRKVVYLTGIPCSLVENFKLVMTGLWARLAWKQAGHSSQSIHHILDVARRLSSVHFVVVMLILQDVLGGIIRPFAKTVQKHLEPASFVRAQQLALAKIETARRTIRRVRVVMRVASLCRQHAGPHDLARFLQAHAHGSMGSMFPTFFAHVGGLVSTPCTFRGCKLEAPDVHDRSQLMFLGAHCQCAAKERHWAASRHGRRSPLDETRAQIAHPRHPGRFVRIPVWAAEQRDVRRVDGEDCVEVNPRCVVRPVGLRAPPGQMSTGMFRNRITEAPAHEVCHHINAFTQTGAACPCRWTSRCQVSRRVFLADCECNAGLAEAGAFLETLATELLQVLSSVGVNQTMSTILTSAAKCWDWSRLALERPTADDVRAFRCVAALLRHQSTLHSPPLIPHLNPVGHHPAPP
jgi:hypothetical protein